MFITCLNTNTTDKSIIDTLLLLTQDLQYFLEKWAESRVAFFDFCSTFDSVNLMGAGGFIFVYLKIFLTNRKLRVLVNSDLEFEFESAIYGVP